MATALTGWLLPVATVGAGNAFDLLVFSGKLFKLSARDRGNANPTARFVFPVCYVVPSGGHFEKCFSSAREVAKALKL